jgi:hypothetical protein
VTTPEFDSPEIEWLWGMACVAGAKPRTSAKECRRQGQSQEDETCPVWSGVEMSGTRSIRPLCARYAALKRGKDYEIDAIGWSPIRANKPTLIRVFEKGVSKAEVY